mmetsp:Transcript_16877/g.64270  ORF Transcript_16877/g.64270 Transcript_16877/m.64270 type:complete len:99 (+) Transcript_16877:152-448(+)
MSESKSFDVQAFKDSSRTSRLSTKVDRKLREELHQLAYKKCDEEAQRFVSCSKANGFLVVFNCREQLAALNKCCKQYSTEEEFEKYKAMRLTELEKMS